MSTQQLVTYKTQRSLCHPWIETQPHTPSIEFLMRYDSSMGRSVARYESKGSKLLFNKSHIKKVGSGRSPVTLESALNLVRRKSPCGAHYTYACCARSNDHLFYFYDGADDSTGFGRKSVALFSQLFRAANLRVCNAANIRARRQKLGPQELP